MALYIPHSIFHLALLLYVRPETFGPPYYVYVENKLNVKLLEFLKTEVFVWPLFDADGFLLACMNLRIMQNGTSAPGRVIFVDKVKSQRSGDSSC